jgi:hypothetical protein
VENIYFPLLSKFEMFGFVVEKRIFGYFNTTLIVAPQRGGLVILKAEFFDK